MFATQSSLATKIKRGSLIALTFLTLALSPLVNAALPVQSAGFVDKQYSVKGDWSLFERDGAWVLQLGDKFKTKSGPDLKIFLSPQSIDQVTGKTATNGAVLVSKLKNNKGGQEYVLPAGVNPADFQSVLIHCEAFSVLWGGADL